ncbi:MAG: hypothetical protein Q9160_003168 [Pyrenula sp. 1 TL-2023]
MPSIKNTILLASILLSDSSIAGYTLTHDYSGEGFFAGFEFFNDKDPTNGFVKYIDDSAANSAKLAGMLHVQGLSDSKVQGEQAASKPAYMGVDFETENPPAPGRQSIRISSKESFNHGLFVADIQHMPAATCGVWPAYWLLADPSKYTWPAGGEIDILEGVNTGTSNQMTLHTSQGCSIPQSGNSSSSPKNNADATFTGHVVNADCISGNGGDNAGCGIVDDKTPANFGTDFNQAGGGIYATEWTSDSIKIWFFSRNSTIPSDLAAATALSGNTAPVNISIADSKAESPGNNSTNPSNSASSPSLDPSTWGTPAALFPSTSCPIDSHFKDMQIIFNTALCGDWAGKVWDTTPTCKAKAPTCQQYVASNPGDFAEAYWAIKGVKVFQSQ